MNTQNRFQNRILKSFLPEWIEIGFFADFALSVTTKDVIAYADVVKNSGFNIDVEIDARAYEGESRYLFWAYNKAGYFVEIYWYSSGSGMAMRK